MKIVRGLNKFLRQDTFFIFHVYRRGKWKDAKKRYLDGVRKTAEFKGFALGEELKGLVRKLKVYKFINYILKQINKRIVK